MNSTWSSTPTRLGLLSTLSEHRRRNIETDNVGTLLGHHHRKPASAAGNFENPFVLDRTQRREDRLLLAPINERPTFRKPLVVILLGDIVGLIPLFAFHSWRNCTLKH